jgi:hypothetical protein
VCIDPLPGKSSLTELPLPPAEEENYLSKVATASADVESGQITAELVVSLNVEGLYLVDDARDLSPRAGTDIKAIMDVVKAKVAKSNHQSVDENGQFRRTLLVRERS